MKKKKAKKIIRRVKNPRSVLVNFRVSLQDKKLLEQLADKYAEGNWSVWLRHSGLNYRPKKSEVIS